MKLFVFSLLVLSGTATVTNGASLGLLEIFNNFVNVTDLVNQFHPILRPIVKSIFQDVREMIPELEKLLDKHNISEEILKELGKSINMTFICNEVLPELGEAMEEANVSEIVEEIRKHLDLNYVEEHLFPKIEEFVKDNNVSDIFDEIRGILNITFIADELLPEIERMLEKENISAIVSEVNKILDLADVSSKLIPSIIKILESNNITSILKELDHLFNTTKIFDHFSRDIEELVKDLELNETIGDIKKILKDIKTVGNEALDELQKIIDDNNITIEAPDLVPFINLERIRGKLDEVQNILDYMEILGIVEEIERLLNVTYLREKILKLDEVLESIGFSHFIRDIKDLIESIDFVRKEVTAIKGFLRSGNLPRTIDDVEKFLNVSHIRKMVEELERMVAASNLTNIIDEAEKMINTTYLSKNIIPEIQKLFDEYNIPETIEMLLNYLNITFLEETCAELEKEYNITDRGERISKGELAEVVNEVVDDIFRKDVMVDEMPTIVDDSSVTTTPKPAFCDKDCDGVPCGTAVINLCGQCVLGNTGHALGHGTDCNNECGGKARIDDCDACTNPPADDKTGKDSPLRDCNGVCYGGALVDSCRVCSGGTTRNVKDHLKDACGECNGDNTTCAGCDGVPNSGKVVDSCDVCGGNGSTCTTIKKVVPSLLPSTSLSRDVLVIGAGLQGDDANSIKCVYNGQESAGVSIDNTHCRCTIPDNQTPGEKDFTVKVVKNAANVQTADLKVTIYDVLTTKITALIPSELFTRTEVNVTFTGSGLTSQNTAVCMIGDFKRPATYHTGSYKCTLPAIPASRKITIDLSLNGVHKLASDVSLDRTVFASAPTLTSARFTDTGALIHVIFDKFVNTSSLKTCASIFVDVAHLGTNPDCSWSDKRHLVISPGDSATVRPGFDSLKLKVDVVKCDKEQYSKFSASAFKTIESPRNAAAAVAVIKGPKQVSSCGNLTLDASASKGGGGRDLKYRWSLVGGSNAGITTVLDDAEDKDKVIIGSNLMTAGSSYTIELEVKNFLSSTWRSTTITVKKVADAAPEVRVELPFDGKVTPARQFLIMSRARAALCSSEKALTFSWSVICTSDDVTKSAQIKVEETSEFKDSSKKAALKIKAGTLVGGRDYKFTVVVALKSTPSVATTVDILVQVEWSPLQAQISGGDRAFGRDSGPIVFDAETPTFDPDNAPGSLKCLWSCKDLSNGQPCYSALKNSKIAMPDVCVIKVQSSEFKVGKYEIKSSVSKGSRTASSSVLLSIVAGAPIVVGVIRQEEHVNANKRVTLRVTYTSKIEPVVSVSSVESDDYQYIDLDDKSIVSSKANLHNSKGVSIGVMVFKENVLTPGASYKFVVVVDAGTNNGSNYIIVHVKTGPTSGTLELSSKNLTAMDTLVLKAKNWVTDPDAYPLKYKFGIVKQSGMFDVWRVQTKNELSIEIPPGAGNNNEITIRLEVKDKFGARKAVDTKVTVVPLTKENINTDDLVNIAKKALVEAQDTKDFRASIPKMKSMMQTFTRANVPDEDVKKVATLTLSMLLNASSTSFDNDDAKMLINSYVDISPKYIDDAKSAIKGFQFAAKATAFGGDTEKEEVKASLDWINEMATKIDKSDKEVSKYVLDADQSLGDQLASTVDIGQVAELGEAGDRVRIKVAHTDLQGVFTASSGSGATEIGFGDELASQLGGMRKCGNTQECYGTKVKITSYTEDLYSKPTSSVTGIKADLIIDIELQDPVTGAGASVSGLSDPVNMVFDTPCTGTKMAGYYFDESTDEWSDVGLSFTCVNGKAEVKADHLTAFSVAEVSDSQSSVKSYQVSFVLSTTTWKDGYSDENDADQTALKTQVLNEINDVYQGDSTLQSLSFVRFEKSGDKVKAVVKMAFDASNTKPSDKLKQSIADGTLGALKVDPSSLDFVEVYDQSDDDDDDKTGLIIGIVVGVAFLVLIIVAVSCIVYHKKKEPTKVQSLSHSMTSYDNEGMARIDSRAGLTPV